MAITEFTIKPGVGVEPILFGMTPDQVAEILGRPTVESTTFLGHHREIRPPVSIVYDKAKTKVTEIEFSTGVRVWYQGKSLFELRDLVGFLMKFDPEPYEYVGTITFHKLGIATDLHVESQSERTIAVFQLGYCDDEIEDSVPYRRKSLPRGRKSPIRKRRSRKRN